MPYAGEGFADRAIAGIGGLRSGLAVATDPDQDEPGIVPGQFLVAKPEALERTRTKILDNDVARFSNRADDIPALRSLDIDGQVFLVSQNRSRIEFDVLILIADRAHGIAAETVRS